MFIPSLPKPISRRENNPAKHHYSLHQRDIENLPRSNTCSLGIGRVSGEIRWDVTVYNVAQPERQDVNIIATATGVTMDKGQSMTVSGPSSTITITNVDNAPVFDYNIPDLQAPLDDPANGITKVQLNFQYGSANWTTADCGAGNVIWSAGRESWSCDFAC
jgi:hypothetical protein